MPLNRRQLLQKGAAGAGLIVVGNLGGLFPSIAKAGSPTGKRLVRGGNLATARSISRGYGRLVPDPNKLLDLPEGFSYKVISETGKPTTDGGVLPDRFDGMAVFEKDGTFALVRNSEQSVAEEDEPVDFPATAAPEFTYDPIALGGTTTTEVDADLEVINEYVSLAGTDNNCAGGFTPWATWLSCEETEDVIDDGFEKDHGFVFEVDPFNVENNKTPTPLEGLGRFAHEAVSVDPTTGILYLTEDASGPNGLLYRATPTNTTGAHGSLREGATLEALVAMSDAGFIADLSEVTEIGTTLTTEWVAVPDPLAVEDSTRVQLNKVTRSRKLEGTWWGNDAVYVACSYARHDDGSVNEHDGQVWKLDPAASSLELMVQFGVNPDPASDTFDGPDNITVAPWGGLILCSDGDGAQHLYTVSAEGEPAIFAKNVRDESEFAGATFSADGTILFVNLQSPGLTFAITGPWMS